MKFKKVLAIVLLTALSVNVNAQVEERPRPEGWEKLVYGGRFMDRFLPIPVMGELTDETWGASEVVPRYTDNGVEDNVNSYWGGNAIKGEDGRYNLFVAGWPEISPRGHMYWSKSTVYHAKADNPMGPYKVRRAIGVGHNPTIYKTSEGRYVIYVIDGCFVSDNIDGPWETAKLEYDARDRKILAGLSNMTFAQREDGSYIAVDRGGSVWISKTGETTFNQVTQERVYPNVRGRFEDPVIWKTDVQYHLIVNDWMGRIAWYMRSKDGIHWKLDAGEAYLPGITVYEDGTHEDWFKYERLRVLQDEHGRATQAHFAVIDTLKKFDLPYDNHSSKHVIIPLTVGRLITVLNTKPITAKTKQIEVRVQAEEGFNPHTDIDFVRLRFGVPEAVDFGGGCTLENHREDGKDIILTFDGAGNGFSADNFAGKLLGKTKEGKLLFGYSKLPRVTYIEALLSARKPIIKEGKQLEIEVENFGQVESKSTKIKITTADKDKPKLIASGTVDSIEPLGKQVLTLKTNTDYSSTDTIAVRVEIGNELFNTTLTK